MAIVICLRTRLRSKIFLPHAARQQRFSIAVVSATGVVKWPVRGGVKGSFSIFRAQTFDKTLAQMFAKSFACANVASAFGTPKTALDAVQRPLLLLVTSGRWSVRTRLAGTPFADTRRMWGVMSDGI